MWLFMFLDVLHSRVDCPYRRTAIDTGVGLSQPLTAFTCFCASLNSWHVIYTRGEREIDEIRSITGSI